MNILIVSDAVYPFNKGGKEKRIYELTKRYVGLGHSVIVFTMKWWEEDAVEIEREGVRYIAISKKVSLYSSQNIRSIWQAIYFAIALFAPLFVYRKRFDVIDADQIPYFQLLSIWLANMFLRKPVVSTWHEVFGKEYWKRYLGGMKAVMASAVERISSKTSTIVAVSAATRQDLVEKLGVRADSVHVIENGIDVDNIASIKPHEDVFDFVFAGRLLAHKNVDFLIDALAELKKKYNFEPRVAIIGDGPEKKRLEARVLEQKVNVVFLGFLDKQEDVYRYIKASKGFIFPSEREGFGLVVLEAFACGTPVATIDAEKNHAKDLINDGKTGFILKKDLSLFAQKIKQMHDHSFDQEAMLQTVKKYSWDTAAKKAITIYESMV